MKYQNQFIVFCVIITFLSLWNIRVYSHSKFSERYTSITSGNRYSSFSYFIMVLGFLVFIWSIMWLFLVYKGRMPKFTLMTPIVYIVYYFIWSLIISMFLALVLKHYNPSFEPLYIIDTISRFDIIFYSLNAIVPLVNIYRVYSIKIDKQKVTKND